MANLDLAKFLGEIRSLHYVVQRNWDNLPDGFTKGHEDLDLFVSERDRAELIRIAGEYPKIPIDVRSLEDNYYPVKIGMALLTDRQGERSLFWVPNARAHFLSLYYHNLIHKENNPYGEELKEIFKKAYPPIRCTDSGVGYHV